jgi:hypothetical protein
MGLFTRIPPALRHLGQRWFGRAAAVAPNPSTTSGTVRNTNGHGTGQSAAQYPMTSRKCMPKLRTICTADGALGQHSRAVRVVISGRMADVCAELDRLIALETQPTLN